MRLSGPVLIAVLAAAPARAESGNASATMAVSVEIVPACTVAAAPLRFGRVQGAAGAMAVSQITVNCGPAVPFAVDLDRGRHPDANGRRAYDAASGRYLAYGLYRDAAYRSVLGDEGDGAVAGQTDAGGLFRLTAYGRIEPGQAAIPGHYADEIVVTVRF